MLTVFSVHSRNCNHHHDPILRHFIPMKRRPVPLSGHSPSHPPQTHRPAPAPAINAEHLFEGDKILQAVALCIRLSVLKVQPCFGTYQLLCFLSFSFFVPPFAVLTLGPTPGCGHSFCLPTASLCALVSSSSTPSQSLRQPAHLTQCPTSASLPSTKMSGCRLAVLFLSRASWPVHPGCSGVSSTPGQVGAEADQAEQLSPWTRTSWHPLGLERPLKCVCVCRIPSCAHAWWDRACTSPPFTFPAEPSSRARECLWLAWTHPWPCLHVSPAHS